ncbi:methyltransferase domain-containing protein [Chloroflexota bacterium]
MVEDIEARFDAGAEAWVEYNRQPLGRIRREVTWRNLDPYLPDIAGPQRRPCVLDAGGGSGELALRLAQRGYRVWLLDSAAAMLDQARAAAQRLPERVCSHLSFCCLPVDEAPQAFAAGFFDAIACHTLIEYLPEPRSTLPTLAGLLREGGLLSVSFVNRHAEVLRQVWARGDPAGALASLEDGAFCASLFDIPGKAYTARDVSAWLAEHGLAVTATCGVRIFADYVPRDRLDEPDFFESLLRLELAATTRVPYNLMARYVQLIARKGIEH